MYSNNQSQNHSFDMASSTMEFVSRDGRENVKEVDRGICNRFQSIWMDGKDTLEDFLCEYFRKLKEMVMAWCLTCNMKVNYGSSSKKALIEPPKNHIHVRARKALKSTQSLPAAMAATKSMIECTEPAFKPPAPDGESPSITTFLKTNNLIDANSDKSSSISTF